jgi:hypothetical protein
MDPCLDHGLAPGLGRRHESRSRPERDRGGTPHTAGVPPAAAHGLGGGERGAAAISHTVVIALSMLLFVLCANVIVVVYARGVVRSALDEGVRAGARAAAGVAECQQRVDDVLGQLLGGSMGDGVTARCAETTEAVTALADASFQGWLPGVPAFTFQVAARSAKHPAASEPADAGEGP